MYDLPRCFERVSVPRRRSPGSLDLDLVRCCCSWASFISFCNRDLCVASAFLASTNPSLPSQNLQSVTSSAPLTLLRLPLLHQIILLRETGIVALLHATVLCKIIFDGNSICNLNVPVIGLHCCFLSKSEMQHEQFADSTCPGKVDDKSGKFLGTKFRTSAHAKTDDARPWCVRIHQGVMHHFTVDTVRFSCMWSHEDSLLKCLTSCITNCNEICARELALKPISNFVKSHVAFEDSNCRSVKMIYYSKHYTCLNTCLLVLQGQRGHFSGCAAQLPLQYMLRFVA